MCTARILCGVLAFALTATAVFLGRTMLPADAARLHADPVALQPGSTMVAAAQKLLAGLTDELRAKATFALDDPNRTQWHYYPITPEPRKGAVLKAMTPEQKELVKALLHSGLSDAGYKT